MPYISPEQRPPYVAAAETFLSSLSHNDAVSLLPAAIRAILESVYGTVEDTRYYRQNELQGVLSCMRREWCSRLNLPTNISRQVSFKLTTASGEEPKAFCELLNTVSKAVPLADETLRAGHLNFFISEMMNQVVEKGWLKAAEVPDLIDAIAEWLYEEITRPYEDRAIAKNGDCFRAKLLANALG